MKKDRLLRLADKLSETEPYEGVKLTERMRFDLGTYCTCGTTACAVGHAAVDPWFTRRGLKLSEADEWLEKRPLFKEAESDLAVEFFFGIDLDAVRYLFYDYSYDGSNPRPKTVAKRIREFVAAE